MKNLVQRTSLRKFSTHNNQYYIDLEKKYISQHVFTTPVALVKGKGAFVWDAEGNKYQDWLSGVGSVNQGHCHPKIAKAISDQVKTLH